MFLRKSIKIPIYVGMFDIVVTDSPEAYRKVYEKFPHDDIYGHSIQSSCKKTDRTHFIMVLNFLADTNITHGVIAHETVHITSFILDYVGQDFDANNHECYSYLSQWITDRVYIFLEQNNLKPSLSANKINK